MKNLLHALPFLLLLSFLVFACQENSDPPATLLPVTVKSMHTKQPLSGVAIQVQGSSDSGLTERDGKFVLTFNPNQEKIVQYALEDYDTLIQIYTQIMELEGITVYLEDEATIISLDTNYITGQTVKNQLGKGQVPVEHVLCMESSLGVPSDSIFSTGNGVYNISFEDARPIFEYQFMVDSIKQTVEIVNVSRIKDSTSIDLLLSSNATGIDIKGIKRQ